MSGPGSDGASDDTDRSADGRPDEIDEDERRADRPSDTGPDGAAESPSDGAAETPPSEPTGDRDPPGSRAAGEREAPRRANGSGPGSGKRVTIEDDGVIRWFLETDHGTVVAVRDVVSSVAVVLLIGLILFGISGIWPPLVAVESGSMEPNMYRGDLIFVVDEGRFVGDGSIDGTGVVTREAGQESGHGKFGQSGDVIIFTPDGDERRTPVIHRAHFWVNEGDDWVSQANPSYVNGRSCDELRSCPAPHDGFITKGDANSGYDQTPGGAQTTVVKPEWITGKGMFRIPWLGHVRLTFDSMFSTIVPPAPGSSGAVVPGSSGVVAPGSVPGPVGPGTVTADGAEPSGTVDVGFLARGTIDFSPVRDAGSGAAVGVVLGGTIALAGRRYGSS